MSCSYSKSRAALDLFNEAPRFAPAGQAGDRFEMSISFQGDLPVPIPAFSAPPCVIVTPVRKVLRDGAGFNIPTLACAARDVTAQGFRLTAYNQDPDFGGVSAFNWLAITDSPDRKGFVPDLITGIRPPLHLAPFRESSLGQRTFRDHAFTGAGLFDAPSLIVQLTATDRDIHGHSVAAVGMLDDSAEQSKKSVMVHNVDLAAGECAFNWATFSLTDELSQAGASTTILETGVAPERWFSAGGQPGDWQTWDIVFGQRFAEIPLVLLTATQALDIPRRLDAAVVGVAQSVTTSGFRLAARSCDLRPGLAGFNWLAIGPVV